MKAASEYRSSRREAVKAAARSEKVSFHQLWRQLQDKVGVKTLSRPVSIPPSRYQPHQGKAERARRMVQMERMA